MGLDGRLCRINSWHALSLTCRVIVWSVSPSQCMSKFLQSSVDCFWLYIVPEVWLVTLLSLAHTLRVQFPSTSTPWGRYIPSPMVAMISPGWTMPL